MNQWWLWCLVILGLVGIFFLGRYSVGERIVEVPVSVDVKPVASPYLPAKVDSVLYADLLRQNALLRARISAGGDTVILVDTVTAPVYVYRASIDTTLFTRADLSYIYDGDTVSQSDDVRIRMKVEYLGDPVRAFHFPLLDVEPFSVVLPVKERVRENPISGEWLAFELMGGYRQGGVGMGGEIQVKNIGAGVMLTEQTAPLYFLSLRIPVF